MTVGMSVKRVRVFVPITVTGSVVVGIVEISPPKGVIGVVETSVSLIEPRFTSAK